MYIRDTLQTWYWCFRDTLAKLQSANGAHRREIWRDAAKRHNGGRSVSMGHSSPDVKPQLGVTPNYFQGSRVPGHGGPRCTRVLRVTRSAVKNGRRHTDVPRGGSRTLDVIATEALLRFSITSNALTKRIREVATFSRLNVSNEWISVVAVSRDAFAPFL